MSCSYYYGCFSKLSTVAAIFLCLGLASLLRPEAVFRGFSILFFFVWGTYCLTPWLEIQKPASDIAHWASAKPVILEGIVVGRVSASEDGSRVEVRIERVVRDNDSTSVTGSILLFVPQGELQFVRGDRLRFAGRISVPRRLGLPGEFDYARYLAMQNISAVCRVQSLQSIVLMRSAAEEPVMRWVDIAAYRLGSSIRNSIDDERTATVLAALLIGDQRRIPADLAAAYTRAGVNHILSISGFHVGIIAVCLIAVLVWLATRIESFALHWNIRRTASLFAIPIMAGYLLLTGCAAATARSVMMLSLCAVALYSERQKENINILLMAGFFLVVLNPPALFDVSFQLSFLSLWGIMLVAKPAQALSRVISNCWLRVMIQFVIISSAATCATLLPVLAQFHVASFNGILTNFIIVPLLGYGAVIAGFTVLPLLLIFPGHGSLLLWPAAHLVSWANSFIEWCVTLPVVSRYDITAVDISLQLLVMAVLTFLGSRYHKILFAVAVTFCAGIFHYQRAHICDGKLHVTMLSVGQAESLLVTLPDGSHLLVDGGGYLYDTGHDFGQRILAPALGALKVTSVERVIATHDHPDHSGGLPYILQHFNVSELWSGPDNLGLLEQVAVEQCLKRLRVAAGEQITLPGGVELQILSPLRMNVSNSTPDEISVNEHSLVFRLRYGSFSMLFCADAGFAAEQRLLDRQAELRSTVLKIGHHGSRFSTSARFLDRVAPELALISAGYGNRFGLPSPQTINALRHNRIPFYRTDIDGTVEIVSNGKSWSVATPYRPD